MTDAAHRLLEDRATRRQARELVDANFAQVKADLAARGIGGRIADKSVEELKAVAGEALDIARDSKGVIAAAAGALAVWTFRKPLAALTRSWIGQGAVQDDDDRDAAQPTRSTDE
jgi:hypothetical protein